MEQKTELFIDITSFHSDVLARIRVLGDEVAYLAWYRITKYVQGKPVEYDLSSPRSAPADLIEAVEKVLALYGKPDPIVLD